MGEDNEDKNIEELFWEKLGAENCKEPYDIKSSKLGGEDDLMDKSGDLHFFEIEGELNIWNLKKLNSSNLNRLDLIPEKIHALCFNGITYLWIGIKVPYKIKEN